MSTATHERGHLERFLRWNFFGHVVAAAFVFGLWLLYPWWIALVLAAAVALDAAVVKSAERLAARGEERAAALRFALGAWFLALAVGLLAPIVFPVIVLVAFLPVSVMIPYGSRNLQGVSIAVGGGIATVLAAATLFDPLFPVEFISESAVRTTNVVFIPVVAALFCLSVFYGYQRLSDAFDDLRAANVSLRESEASLEDRVAKRTTELEISRAELAVARDVAITANVAKSRFLAAASHDLRQPIHALRLFAEALGDAEVPDRVHDLAYRIRDSADSLTSMFDELLDLSRLETGTIEAREIAFPLGPLLEQLGAELTPDATAKDLQLRIVPTRLVVHSDPLLLRRILQNLLVNAIRYTESGRVLAGCRRHGKQVRVEVWDTGPGIPADKRTEIFREFTQLDQQQRSQGIGLGLAIVDRLAHLLDCTVEVDSAIGRGSVFRVSVPLAARSETIRSAQAPTPQAGGLAGRLVVVIDDDLNILGAMRILLESWGCELVLARSGEEAAEGLKLRGRAPDVILADYSLEAGTNGVDAIESVRASCGVRAPAVILSGETDPAALEGIRSSGLLHLTKPIPPARLRAALTHCCAASPGRAPDRA